jgi:hypothetical protein
VVALVVPGSWNVELVDPDSSEAGLDSSEAVPSASAPDLLAAGDSAFDPEEEEFQVGRLVAYAGHPEDPEMQSKKRHSMSIKHGRTSREQITLNKLTPGGPPCPPEFTNCTKSSYENVPPLNEALSSMRCQKKRDSSPWSPSRTMVTLANRLWGVSSSRRAETIALRREAKSLPIFWSRTCANN